MTQTRIGDYLGKRVHFTGIGGVSMCGLAKMLATRGYAVTGSDRAAEAAKKQLEPLGIKVFEGNRAEYVDGADLLVFTAAVAADNPERVRARELGIPEMERKYLLGQMMQKYKTAIGVSGTHGKTTTTAMIATILELCGLDPTINIGGTLDLIGGNGKVGGGDVFLTEADEYVDTFLAFHPTIAVITNIEMDHPDYFKDIGHMKSSYIKYIGLLPADGALVANADDGNVSQVAQSAPCRVVTFGLEAGCALSARDITFDASGCARFTLTQEGAPAARVALSVPGQCNIHNALAALAAGSLCGLSAPDMAGALKQYTGTRRRYEKLGMVDGVEIITDYAHNPGKLRALLQTAQSRPHGRILLVFQPHTYSRTRGLFDEFARSFSGADEVILTDIYAAREKDDGTVSSRMLADAVLNFQSCRYAASFDQAAGMLRRMWRPGDVVLLAGAGTIVDLGDALLRKNAQQDPT